MRDLMNSIHPVRAIAPVVATDNTALVSQIIDTMGYGSLAFVIVTGTLADADATFAVTLDHGNAANLSDAAAVPATQMNGTPALASFGFADDGETRKLGYSGGKRYVRLTITPTGNAGNAPIAAVAILGHPLSAPTPNPPA